SATVDANNEILVSVQVFPFTTSDTAVQVFDSFTANGGWDFGIWCPYTGAASTDCSAGYQHAARRDQIRHDHRYLIAATALYTNETPTPSGSQWIAPAVQQAVDPAGPENNPGT